MSDVGNIDSCHVRNFQNVELETLRVRISIIQKIPFLFDSNSNDNKMVYLKYIHFIKYVIYSNKQRMFGAFRKAIKTAGH